MQHLNRNPEILSQAFSTMPRIRCAAPGLMRFANVDGWQLLSEGVVAWKFEVVGSVDVFSRSPLVEVVREFVVVEACA